VIGALATIDNSRIVFSDFGGASMPNDEHVAILKKGAQEWNAWRAKDPDLRPNLIGSDLRGCYLPGADLSWTYLGGANLGGAILWEVNLRSANLFQANLKKADLHGAVLIGAKLSWAILTEAVLTRADLTGADLSWAQLRDATLWRADLSGADLHGADLSLANFGRATLCGANLEASTMLDTNLGGADLTGCRVFGVSAWGLKLRPAKQENLVITRRREPEITVDNIEVAQFVYLMLHNEKIRDAIDTIGKKGVLLLGRFTEGRTAVLERLREELRKRNFMPIIFNFDKPETKDFTETVRLLVGLSRFVIVDVTNPRSAPLELQATVPEYMIPFVPIIERGEEPFSMFRDLWNKHRDWVLDPIRYPSVDRLVEVLDTEIIGPANERYNQLLARKAEQLRIKDV
jgi:uncharacterized protein YjbI with pentapeptide repeats